MNISNIRKQILERNNERNQLVQTILRAGKMIKGTLYESARVCGNPNCKCARGERHVSWYLIVTKEGRSKQKYVGAKVPPNIRKLVERHHDYKRAVMRIRAIDREVSRLINNLHNSVSVSLESVKNQTR